ncbi:uncharacterized protein L201_000990 [Kwoniella dendrophila CBS 6074]|uniref:Uncharacterized protein n=1 Tax=Kwoniella dendrophila CBS 6074 TaxID=1295534 RepID=A0AAX4JMK4_9TREE
MDFYTMNAQAGPSTSRVMLGPPISPTQRFEALPEEEDEDSNYQSCESTPRAILNSFPITPPRPPRSSRRSLDSTISRPSISSTHSGKIIHDWSPLRIQPSHRRASSSHRSSFSSVHPLPGDENRCRVSFDAAFAQPPPLESSVNYQEQSIVRSTSRESSGQSIQQEKGDEVITVKRRSTKKARFLEAPLMTRSDYGTSSDTDRTRHSYLSAFNGEDDSDLYADEFRVPVDEAIRSIPGVVGLGEGWAGGPQGKQKRRWFQRRQRIDEEDPLSLWNQNQDERDKPTSPSSSPLKGIWSRSKRNLFGQSSPALLGEQSSTLPEPPRSASRLGRLFSLSRSNLASPDPSDFHSRSQSSINPIKSKSKRFSLGIFSTSELSLHQNSNLPMPTSPSMPALNVSDPPSPRSRRPRQYSQSTLARSEGDLTIYSQPVDRGSPPQKKHGLPPPWRPTSIIANGRNSLLVVPAHDNTETSGSSTSSDTPITCASSSSSLTRGHALTRTATFGLEDIATEQRIDEEVNPQEEHEPEIEFIRATRNTHNALTQQEVIPTQRTPTPTPQRRPSMKQRKTAWLKKMKSVLTPSNSQENVPTVSTIGQTVDRLLTRRKSSRIKGSSTSTSIDSTPTSSVSTSASTSASTSIINSGEPSMEALRSSPTIPRRKSSRNRHRRSASWMVRSSSSLAKRLSKLTEQEEGETFETRIEDEDEDENDVESIDIEDVDHANRLASPIGFEAAPKKQRRKRKEKEESKMTTFLERRRSSNLSSLLALKSRKGSRDQSLDEINKLPASMSMPVLSKVLTSDLNLHVELEGEELGLEDILDEERRGSIVHSLNGHGHNSYGRSSPNLTIQSEREEAIKSTMDTLSGSPIISRQPSPDPSYKSKMKARHNSLPLNTNLKNNTSNHKRTATVSTVNSSPSPSLITPRHPGELATFLNALTFVDSPVEQDKQDPEIRLGGLTVPQSNQKRNSHSTHRFSGESYLTQPSLYDTEEVIQGHAIRVESIEDMQRQASVISLEELGKNWSGALQMTRA